MTREEAIKMLKSKMNGHTDTSYEWAETVRMAIKALEQEPCEDAISRQAAIDTCLNIYFNGYKEKDLLHDIKNLPSVNPQPKTGHWIKTISENGITSAVRCSKCGFEDNRYMLFRYCPNCGIKMEVEEKSCSNCKFWLLDKNDKNRRCQYCYHQDEWEAESEEQA